MLRRDDGWCATLNRGIRNPLATGMYVIPIAQAWFGVNRPNAHIAKEPDNIFTINVMALFDQNSPNTSAAMSRYLR
ncbi:hypothetical protein AK965_02095 [Vibrio sp. PID17_43]|nr:hypothetical protein AK965_02095 [Vibrio sp. PID17_43]